MNAQVGINTTTPQSDLHVVGDMLITSELRVGGTSSSLGDTGLNNQVLASGGVDQPAAWKDLKSAVPFGTLVSSLQGEKRTGDIQGGVYSKALYNSSTDSFFYDSKYLTYDSGGVYTVLIPGFYRLYATVSVNVSSNTLDSEGWTRSSIKKINSSGVTSVVVGQTTLSSHGYTPISGQTLSGIDYLKVGDKLWLEYGREVKTDSRQFSFSILYTGR